MIASLGSMRHRQQFDALNSPRNEVGVFTATHVKTRENYTEDGLRYWRKLHNEELQWLYLSLRWTKSWKMTWIGDGERSEIHREFWLGNIRPKNISLGRDSPRWTDKHYGNIRERLKHTFLWYETYRTENGAYNNSSSIVSSVICCCRDMFTEPLPSNDRGHIQTHRERGLTTEGLLEVVVSVRSDLVCECVLAQVTPQWVRPLLSSKMGPHFNKTHKKYGHEVQTGPETKNVGEGQQQFTWPNWLTVWLALSSSVQKPDSWEKQLQSRCLAMAISVTLLWLHWLPGVMTHITFTYDIVSSGSTIPAFRS
jgi:hypothetical protein